MEKIELKYLDKEINNLKIHERYNELTDFGKEKLKSFIEIRKQLSIAVVVVSEAELCQYDKMCVRRKINDGCPYDCKDDTRKKHN
tara:strand:+ start:159 stop:413 length:255 start_codon:yes stop_codon:yes gene_type:complete